MKRFTKRFAVIALLLVFLTGCSTLGLKLSTDQETTAITTASIIAGDVLAKKNPDLARTALPYIKTLSEAAKSGDPATFVNDLFPAAVKQINKQISDPVISAAVVAALTAVKVEPTTGSTANTDVAAALAKIKLGMDGFIAGMNAAGIN